MSATISLRNNSLVQPQPGNTTPSVRVANTNTTHVENAPADVMVVGRRPNGNRSNSTSAVNNSLAPQSGRRVKPTAGERNLQKHMPSMYQGYTNACGTTSLSMSLAYLGVPSDFRVVDESIRPWGDMGLGSSPIDLVTYARRAGVQAEMVNDASMEDMAKHVEAGRPVTVLMNTLGGTTHYVNIVGIERNADGDITGVKTRDPGGGDRSYDIDTFNELWSDTKILPGMQGLPNTLCSALPLCNRLFIVMDQPENPKLPKGDYSKELEVSAASSLISSLNGMAGSVNTIANGHVLAGSASLAGNTVETVVSGASYLVGTVIGTNVENGGDAALATGIDMLEGNVFEKGGGLLLLVTGSAMKGVGWITNKIGGLASEGGEAISNAADIGSEYFNKRDETRDRILNDVDWSRDILERASTQTKINMLENLLVSFGKPGQDDQYAAAQILSVASKNSSEYMEIAKHFGGERQMLAYFRGAQPQTQLLLRHAQASR